MRWRLVSGNPETPITGGALDLDKDEYSPIYGRVNSSRGPLFHQLDLRVDKRWIYDTWRFSLYMDIQNVYNSASGGNYDYNYDFSERRRGQGLPVLPILGFKGEF